MSVTTKFTALFPALVPARSRAVLLAAAMAAGLMLGATSTRAADNGNANGNANASAAAGHAEVVVAAQKPFEQSNPAGGQLQAGDFVAVIGDSITEQKDYSVNIETYLLACQPAEHLQAMQFGWGGETAEGFYRRMVNDCLRYKPTVATTCYGMNDGRYGPETPANAKWYRDNQKAIVQTLKKAGVRFIVVGSPGCVDVNTFRNHNHQMADIYNKTLAEERDISKAVAQEEGVGYADVFDPMYDVMTKAEQKYGKNYHVAGGDGVHPSGNGHIVMAYAFLKGLGCDGNVGTITVDAASGKADATDGHKVLSSEKGSVEIESSRYPYCFTGGEPANPSTERSVLEFLPFNQDLNRLTLVVKGASSLGQKVKVTWGAASKEFDAAELEKGINLASEFLDNPFSAPFAKVRAAVQTQQNYETPMIKDLVHGLGKYNELLPEDKDIVDKLAMDLGKKDRALIEAAVKTVQPVKYTIKIEAVK